MNLLIILLLLYFLTILETTLTPFNLVLGLVIIVSLRLKTPLISIITATIGGLFYDAVSGRLLGFSSFAMLLISGFYLYLKEKFSLKNPILRLVLTFFVYLGYQLVFVKTWQFKEAIIMAIIITLLTQTKEEVIKL